MKKTIAVLTLANGLLATQAAVFNLDIEPGGLNGLNERPTPIITTATGGEIGTGMSLDTSTHKVTVNYGWGTDNGFTDLSDAFTATHIHGPADLNSSANPPLYNFVTLGFVNQTSASDGTVSGILQLIADPNGSSYSIAQQEADLQNGLWYVNVHTVANPGGEIRGQLVPAPVPEPQTYAMIAGFGLLGFAAYRRFKVQTA
jgi:hypothetical protein